MKGVIVNCIQEMITSKYGAEKWTKILSDAKIPQGTVFLAHADIEDANILKIIDAVCRQVGWSDKDFSVNFGDYWVNTFSQRLYSHIYRSSKNAKEFLMKMNEVHQEVTRNIPGSKPPQFLFETIDNNTLEITYQSKRGLFELFIGLVMGVGKYYNDALKIDKLSNNKIRVHFS